MIVRRRRVRAVFFASAVLLVAAPRAEAAIAFVQSAQLNVTSTSGSKAFTSANGAGNFIVVAFRIGSTTATPTVSDTRSNSYAQAVAATSGTDHKNYIFYAQNVAAGANTVTISISPASSTIRMSILEYSGVAKAGALDQTNNGAGNSGSPSSGNVTTTQANELIVSIASVDNTSTFTAGTNFTEREEVATKCSTEDRVVSSIGTYAGTWTLGTSDPWACAVATFKARRRVIIIE